MKPSEQQADPAIRQLSKQELEQIIVIDATPDEIACTMRAGDAPPREKEAA